MHSFKLNILSSLNTAGESKLVPHKQCLQEKLPWWLQTLYSSLNTTKTFPSEYHQLLSLHSKPSKCSADILTKQLIFTSYSSQVQQGKKHLFTSFLQDWDCSICYIPPKDQLCFPLPWKQKVFQSCRGQQWLLTESHWKPWGSLCPGSCWWWHIQVPSWALAAEVWSPGAPADTPGEGGPPAAAGEQLFVLATLH